MRQKKIRGHKRRQRQIELWRLDNLSIDLKEKLLNGSERYYTKINVHPWNSLSLTNSETPQPKGKTKQKMLTGLLDIYENWKNQLDKIGQPYYLKVWIFEPRFSQSQVVCATGESIDFYSTIFNKPEKPKTIPADNYGSLKKRLATLNWDHRLDEDHYDNSEVGEPEMYVSIEAYEERKKWFGKLLKQPHKTHKLKEPVGDITETYSFKQGEVWLGGK